MAGKNIGGGTAAELTQYLDVLVEKGRATSGAINPLKTAFTKVMEAVDGANWGQVKVDSIDTEDYMARFANLTNGVYTDKSISVYKSRMKRVIDWYLKFLASPGWMPSLAARAPRNKALKKETAAAAGNDTVEESEAGEKIKVPIGMHKIDLALRTDAPVTLVLPRDIKAHEVATIKAILDSLATHGGNDEGSDKQSE